MDDPEPTLAFTATTSSGDVLEFQLPLHPHTSSRDHVGALLEGVLDRVSDLVDSWTPRRTPIARGPGPRLASTQGWCRPRCRLKRCR